MAGLSKWAWMLGLLKWRQIGAQLIFRLRWRLERPERFAKRKPENIEVAAPVRAVNRDDGRENEAGEIRSGDFTFLNRKEHLGCPPDWECVNLPALWRYKLHYFDWVKDLHYEDAKAVVADWIERHPLKKGAIGWDPYPTSLRLENWSAILFGKHWSQTTSDPLFLRKLKESIYLQAEWLSRHLETHFLANHLFENVAGLAFVGSVFEGKPADRWYRIGLKYLRKEIPEQILADGTHFERSPMYHARITEVMELLHANGRQELQKLVKEPLVRMKNAMECLVHPDGKIALLNDSVFEEKVNP